MNETQRIQAALRRELDQLRALRGMVLEQTAIASATVQEELRTVEAHWALLEEQFQHTTEASLESLHLATLATKHLIWEVKKGYGHIIDQLPSR